MRVRWTARGLNLQAPRNGAAIRSMYPLTNPVGARRSTVCRRVLAQAWRLLGSPTPLRGFHRRCGDPSGEIEQLSPHQAGMMSAAGLHPSPSPGLMVFALRFLDILAPLGTSIVTPVGQQPDRKAHGPGVPTTIMQAARDWNQAANCWSDPYEVKRFGGPCQVPGQRPALRRKRRADGCSRYRTHTSKNVRLTIS